MYRKPSKWLLWWWKHDVDIELVGVNGLWILTGMAILFYILIMTKVL